MLILNNSISEIMTSILSLALKEDEAVFIMMAEKGKPDILKMIEELNAKNIIFFGGIFPGIIYGKENFNSGAILSKIKISEKPILIKNLSKGYFDIPEINV